MRGLLEMLIATKKRDAQEIPMASVATTMEQGFPKPIAAITSEVPIVGTSTLGTEEEVELNNMIGVVEVTGSP